MKKRWIKITVGLRFTVPNAPAALVLAVKFKGMFHVEHLYFARYENEQMSTFEVSAETSTPWDKIKKFFKSQDGVTTVKIEDRGTGSMAHAMAFEAVRLMPLSDEKKIKVGGVYAVAYDNAFGDVIHWMANMHGLDYMREIKFYGYQIVYFSDMLAKAGQQAMENLRLRQLNDLAQRRMSGAGSAGRAPKTAKCAPAGARKTRAA